jgi:hypothetical protein
MGGGGGERKNKNRAGETEKKKIRAPEKFEKKIFLRLFNRTGPNGVTWALIFDSA